MADRQFFVNHHEQDGALITAPVEKNRLYEPYEKVELPIRCEGVSEPTVFSLSIRDANTDEVSYDNGNILTDLLLSSELRGFIAYPAYYFESDDEAHRRHLDQLMMVQGWRKYKWQELADTARQMRYQPETTMTVEGHVYQMPSINEVEPTEINTLPFNIAYKRQRVDIDGKPEELYGSEKICDYIFESKDSVFDWIVNTVEDLELNQQPVKKEVMVEAEIIVGKDIVGSTQLTDKGRFLFQIPPFYGGGYLKLKAYKEKDSLKKSMGSRKDVKILNEDAYSDFYVKRDLFYPRYTGKYGFYESHQPDVQEEELIDTLSDLSMENDVIQLGNVNVKGRRRGKRRINWEKPAFVLDAYDMYNELTDYGLSYGKFDMRLFPIQVCHYLFGNMNRSTMPNVDGRLEAFTFYRNYMPVEPPPMSGFTSEGDKSAFMSMMETHALKQSPYHIHENLKLKRLSDIRVFTDYVHRADEALEESSRYSADATVELVTFAEGVVQPSFRDRHIYFQGINYAEDFYQPDYSNRQPTEPTDYRRTLYWNPNAKTDETGCFTATFYNNSRPTRIKMTAAGVTHDGRLLHSK